MLILGQWLRRPPARFYLTAGHAMNDERRVQPSTQIPCTQFTLLRNAALRISFGIGMPYAFMKVWSAMAGTRL
jgi:hypothetical protein